MEIKQPQQHKNRSNSILANNSPRTSTIINSSLCRRTNLNKCNLDTTLQPRRLLRQLGTKILPTQQTIHPKTKIIMATSHGRIKQMNRTLKLAVFASHNGTNIREVKQACDNNTLEATVELLISNNSKSSAMTYFEEHEVPTFHISGKTHPDADNRDKTILEILEQHEITHIILSGYMKKLGPKTIEHYSPQILNIHPAPLPEFGGKGMYGVKTLQAVLEAGLEQNKITLHIVDQKYDTGPTIRTKTIDINPEETAEELFERGKGYESELLIEVLKDIQTGEIDLTEIGYKH